MKIIAFAGSTSIHSINKKLATFVGSSIAAKRNAELEIMDLNDFDVPIYSTDRENRGEIPPQVNVFIEKISQADALVVSLAEHNGTYTAAFKNLMDWASRVQLNFFNTTPMFLLSTSPGGYGGGNVMDAALIRFPKFQANIICSLKFPSFNDNFSEESGIVNSELSTIFEEKLEEFLHALK